MVESAEHLADHVPPAQPIRQWVPTFPYPPRFLFAARPQVSGQVLGVVHRHQFKQPFQDGTTQVVLDPPDFIARLAKIPSAAIDVVLYAALDHIP